MVISNKSKVTLYLEVSISGIFVKKIEFTAALSPSTTSKGMLLSICSSSSKKKYQNRDGGRLLFLNQA